jgi:SAM-dependent methyltransferase
MAIMVDDFGKPEPYAQIPELYDLEHEAFTDDLAFYLNCVKVVGDPVLELGCGTGRIVRTLAKAGFRVIGLDQSGPMLDRARSLLEPDLAERVTFVHGSMEECEKAPGGPFGTVILSLNGLLHLPSSEAQRRTLDSARRALDPRGQLLIDVLNPSPGLFATFDRGVVHEGTWVWENGDDVNKFSSRSVSHAHQLIHTRIWYDILTRGRTVSRIVTEFDQRFVYPSELELMLELAGFAEWQVYGSYDLDPFEDDSDRLIVAAEATPS